MASLEKCRDTDAYKGSFNILNKFQAVCLASLPLFFLVIAVILCTYGKLVLKEKRPSNAVTVKAETKM